MVADHFELRCAIGCRLGAIDEVQEINLSEMNLKFCQSWNMVAGGPIELLMDGNLVQNVMMLKKYIKYGAL